MESQSFFCFPFKGHICHCKSLEITSRSVEAMKKENFCPLKKKNVPTNVGNKLKGYLSYKIIFCRKVALNV